MKALLTEFARGNFCLKWSGVFMAAIGIVHFAAAYSPIIDGAMADVRIKVVDDLGEVVPDATISVAFYTAPEKVDVKRGVTDAQGCFSAKGRCIGEAYAWIRKDGYYNTKISPKFQTLTDNETESRRKWSDETVETTATLKKKRNPAKLILKGGTFQELKYPATNVVMGLDLQRFDWCPPYGKGKYDDLQIKYDFWRSPTNWFQVYSHLDITLTNSLDGVYLAPTDDFSKMNRCYGADTNAVYLKALEFVYDRHILTTTHTLPPEKSDPAAINILCPDAANYRRIHHITPSRKASTCDTDYGARRIRPPTWSKWLS